MGCASREADSVIDHLHSPTDFGSVHNVGNDGPKSLFVLPRRWGRGSQALKYSPIGVHRLRLGRLISEKGWTSRTLIRRYLQTKEKEMEREDPRTCVFSPSGLAVRRVVGESVAGLFVQQLEAATTQALPPDSDHSRIHNTGRVQERGFYGLPVV